MARTSRMQPRMSRHVAADDKPFRHSLKSETCTQSTSGFSSERGCSRSVACAQSSSIQRCSTSQPTCQLGLAARSAAIAGSPWIMSPMALMRTTRTRNCFAIRAFQLFQRHRAEALLGKRTAHDSRSPRKELRTWPRMSVVEWSLGSPTISTRPPQAMTSSRSGTVSRV